MAEINTSAKVAEVPAENIVRFQKENHLLKKKLHGLEVELLDVSSNPSFSALETECISVISVEGSCVFQEEGGVSVNLQRFDSIIVTPGKNCQLSGQGRCIVIRFQPDSAVKKNNTGRLSSFKKLKAVKDRFVMKLVPPVFRAILSPEELYLVVGPAGGRLQYGITGPDKQLITIVKTPPGTGPALHVHTLTYEYFIVLEGTFRVFWGLDGEHEVTLNQYDAIAIPPGVNRAFENIGGENNWFMPVVIGANDELEDIVWYENIRDELAKKLSGFWMFLASTFVLKFIKRPG